MTKSLFVFAPLRMSLRAARRAVAVLVREQRAAPCPRVVRALNPCHFTRGYATRSWEKYPFNPEGALDEHGRIPASPYDMSALPGSAPEYDGHLILLPKEYPHPDVTWPSHIDATCPLYAELSSRVREGGSLAGYGLSFAANDTPIEVGEGRAGLQAWDPHRTAAMRAPPNQAMEDEEYTLYAYRTPGLFVKYPEPLSLRTMPSGEMIRTTLDTLFKQPEAHLKSETHVFVCTHGTRDCRCGVVGTEVHDSLVEKVREHAEECAAKGSKPVKRVRVFQISHVGGHKWAANALIYPHGDWYGNLRPSDTPLLLRAALAPSSSKHDLDDLRERLVVWPRWRGRLGMKKLVQQEHMSVWGPPLIHTAQLTPRARGTPASAPAPEAAVPKASATSDAPGTPVPLRFHGHDGKWYDVDGLIGESLMETAKRHDLPGIEATCGGELECATCHAYLCNANPQDPDGRGEIDREPSDAPAIFGSEPSDEEDDMLEYAIRRKPSSRLTCQIPVTRRLLDWMQQGGRVELSQY